jgi:hypothetical protein
LAVPPTANLLWPSAKTILNENEKTHLCPVGIDERKRSMCWEVKRGNFAMSKYQVMWWSRKISKDRREEKDQCVEKSKEEILQCPNIKWCDEVERSVKTGENGCDEVKRTEER